MAKDHKKSDEILMWEYVHGDQESFECLYRKHSKKIFGYIMTKVKNKEETQEIFQVVFRKLHQNRDKYKKNMPFLPWIFTICKHSLIDNRRKEKTQSAHLVRVEDIDICGGREQAIPDPNELHNVSGFSKLTLPEQEVLQLKYFKDLDYEEMSKLLGHSESNMRKRVSRALQKMRNLGRKRLPHE